MINYLPEILINAVLLLVLIILISVPAKTFLDTFNFLLLLKSKSQIDDRIAEYFSVSKKHKDYVTTVWYLCIICTEHYKYIEYNIRGT